MQINFFPHYSWEDAQYYEQSTDRPARRRSIKHPDQTLLWPEFKCKLLCPRLDCSKAQLMLLLPYSCHGRWLTRLFQTSSLSSATCSRDCARRRRLPVPFSQKQQVCKMCTLSVLVTRRGVPLARSPQLFCTSTSSRCTFENRNRQHQQLPIATRLSRPGNSETGLSIHFQWLYQFYITANRQIGRQSRQTIHDPIA